MEHFDVPSLKWFEKGQRSQSYLDVSGSAVPDTLGPGYEALERYRALLKEMKGLSASKEVREGLTSTSKDMCCARTLTLGLGGLRRG